MTFYEVPCYACGARIGESCRDARTRAVVIPHAVRRAALLKADPEPSDPSELVRVDDPLIMRPRRQQLVDEARTTPLRAARRKSGLCIVSGLHGRAVRINRCEKCAAVHEARPAKYAASRAAAKQKRRSA